MEAKERSTIKKKMYTTKEIPAREKFTIKKKFIHNKSDGNKQWVGVTEKKWTNGYFVVR